MKTIILDFFSGEVFIFSHPEMQNEELEELITEKYNFSINNIEWMSMKSLNINYLDEGVI